MVKCDESISHALCGLIHPPDAHQVLPNVIEKMSVCHNERDEPVLHAGGLLVRLDDLLGYRVNRIRLGL